LRTLKAKPRPKSPNFSSHHHERAKKKKRIEEEEAAKPQTPWNLSKSVFNTFVQDTEVLMDKCFDFDWRCSRIEKILDNASKD
jgi:hypothetical protein